MGKLLATGCAGFIGYHLCEKILAKGIEIVGIDNINSYYSPSLKIDRLERLKKHNHFTYYQLDIQNHQDLNHVFSQHNISHVVNLAAQAGVRYSIENPESYINSNIVGFSNVIEACRQNEVIHLIYASSSSVYGLNSKVPFSIFDRVDHPISLYAATKKSNELIAHSYSHLYNLPTTGLRFFTVYGPWGRPDMAYFLFAKNIMVGKPIKVFNHGKMKRDFTYIDDIVEGIFRMIYNPPHSTTKIDQYQNSPSYKIYNIGNHKPVELMYFIELLEEALGKKSIKEMVPMQPGDMLETYADIDNLIHDTGFKPSTSIEDGIFQFANWFKAYYDESKILFD